VLTGLAYVAARRSSHLRLLAASWAWEESRSGLREQVSMQQRRIGPDNPGLSRFFAARLMLVLIAGFYLAGATLAVMYAMGMDPLTHRW
jgi:hypothetical protein